MTFKHLISVLLIIGLQTGCLFGKAKETAKQQQLEEPLESLNTEEESLSVAITPETTEEESEESEESEEEDTDYGEGDPT